MNETKKKGRVSGYIMIFIGVIYALGLLINLFKGELFRTGSGPEISGYNFGVIIAIILVPILVYFGYKRLK